MSEIKFQEPINQYIKKYLNKKEIMYRLPSTVPIEEFWPKLVEERKKLGTSIPLKDQAGHFFWYCLNDFLVERIKIIDDSGTKSLIQHVKQDIYEKVKFEALIDEALHSSAIEGAFSTKKRTKEMVEKKSKPVNKSERMIINNYLALNYILENLHKPLDEEIVLSIYRILTEDTLDPEDIVEKYRNDTVIVWDYSTQNQIYEGPPHTKVQSLMDDLFSFIHTEDQLHPVIKACIIHFYFVYIHPFFDGNGRTARAISYMYLLQKGYDFFKFFSISSVVREHKNKYYKAIKDVEDYNSDLTYFLNYYADMIADSIISVLNKLQKEYGRIAIHSYLEQNGILLSKRQIKLLEKFIKGDKNFILIEDYRKQYKVVYETARTDLNELEALGFLTKFKQGKKYIYKFVALENLVLK
ncbi:MAG: Fic family protein [Clostridia bacterium]|nr:Fic family protein [Clostridia bacterium]